MDFPARFSHFSHLPAHWGNAPAAQLTPIKIPYFRYCINEKIPLPLHPDNLANVILVDCLVIYELRPIVMIGLFIFACFRMKFVRD